MLSKMLARLRRRWIRLRYKVRVEGGNNLPPLIICRHRTAHTPALLSEAIAAYMPQSREDASHLSEMREADGNIPPWQDWSILLAGHQNRHHPFWHRGLGAVYLNDLNETEQRKLLQEYLIHPWHALFVEETPATNLGLVKFNSAALQLAAKINDGLFSPADIADEGGFWRRRIVIRLGDPHQLPQHGTYPQLARALADALETCATKDRADNISNALLLGGQRHSWHRPLFADAGRPPLSYRKTYLNAWLLGSLFLSDKKTRAGIMLPSSAAAATVFYSMLLQRMVPVMLNPAAGARNLISACRTAEVNVVYTSQQLLANLPAAKIAAAEMTKAGLTVIPLEKLREKITLPLKLRALWAALFPARSLPKLPGAQARRDEEAAVLFTSGSEGEPKGVVLSHDNFLANTAQVLARLGDLRGEKMFNSLPVFHCFGLLAGVLLPVAGGITAMHYPTPLHYRLIPDLMSRFRPAIFFSADSFLAAYGREGHSLDMSSLRYVFAGAEKLKESTRQRWASKFGVRILEGYGVTETSPAVAVNTTAENRPGTVGRLLSGMEGKLVPVAGVTGGGELLLRGPNIMLGYFHASRPGVLSPPPGNWHSTGDIASIAEDGFVRIIGRVRRFIKVAGEMVPLDGIEEALAIFRAEVRFAVVSAPDKTRGEQVIVLTTDRDITRPVIAAAFQEQGLPPLWAPRLVIPVDDIPQLPTGKTNYPAATELARQTIAYSALHNEEHHQAEE